MSAPTLLDIINHEQSLDDGTVDNFWEAASHPYECDCVLCKEYWRLINEEMAREKI